MTCLSSLERAVLLAALILGPRTLHAQQTDVIRGRITGPDSQPLPGVTVRATSYQGSVEKRATTDKAGRFTLIFINGEGDYWIDLTKIGYTAKRYEVRKIGDEEVILANARMSDAATKLGAVEVTAERDRKMPTRNANEPDVGGGDRALTTATVSPDQAGNLAAMAAAVAGFQIIPGLDGAADAFSALGLTGDQNNTTFDGLGSGVGALPPDILATTSIHPYPFDVSIGGFSGAQVSIQTIPGTNFSRRAVTTVGITPPLEWASRTALAQGQKYTNLRLGGNAAGPILPDRAFYNVAYNIGRRLSDIQTLLNTDPVGLAAAGVSADSAARLVTILRNHGIPSDYSGAPSMISRDVAQLSGNVDLTPSESGAGNSFTIGGAANYQRSQPVSRGGLLLTTPAHGGENSFWGANATIVHSNYLWSTVLTKTTLGFAMSGNSTSPYEHIPEGNVRVSSTLPDGSASVKSLLFGGGSTLSSLGNQALQLTNQLTWFTANNKHSLKLTSSVMRDAFHNDLSPSLLGSYAFNSLADLDAGAPSNFTRTLGSYAREGSQLSGALSLGDSWRPSDGLQVQYGIRADANHFLSTPALNEGIRNTLGVDNSAVPNHIYISPRIGLQWYYGHSQEIEYAPGSARPPRAVIHAGAGIFQNIAPSQMLGTAVSSTGLPNSTQAITCVGAATPTPDWNAFLTDVNAIPTHCANGSTGSVFATSAPNVTLFDRNYRQPKSLRAAADWSGPIFDNRFVLGVQSIISSGLDQQSLIDVNLDPAARFNLRSEGQRPVFVDPSAIVPTTGAIAIAASRVTPAYQHVWETRSNLKIQSKQVSINFKPVTANPMLRWEATYTLLDARQTYSGFTSTAGNPFDVARGQPLQRGRHTLLLHWSDFPIFDLVYLSAFVTLTSGQRYTPMVAGDVNGDGLLNDRAFVLGPAGASATSTDAAQAAAMQSLLSNSTPSVRACLQRQLNTLAARGSCQTPWTAFGAMLIQFNPQKIGLPKRATVTLTLQNPLALADLAMHGSNDLRGWGEYVAPDENLLFVRGFDPATRQFKYDVNQRFGSTRPQQSSTYALPFISLGLSIDIGVPRERQMLTQRMNLGRRDPGDKVSATAMASFGMSAIPNPMLLILRQSDSLQLTRAQADSLATMSKAFQAFADSVWTPAGKALAAMPDDYSTGEAFTRYSAARARTVDFLIGLVPSVKGVLTAGQRRRLPVQVQNFLDERVLKFLRTSSVGDGGAVGMRR